MPPGKEGAAPHGAAEFWEETNKRAAGGRTAAMLRRTS
jgi:hypothetical protein